MFRAVRGLSLISSLALVAAVAIAAEKANKPDRSRKPSALPRYQFEIGQQFDYAAQSAERRAKVIGQEAAGFETTDLDDHPFLLHDLRGKVVLVGYSPTLAAELTDTINALLAEK